MPSKWSYQGNKKIFESPDGGKTIYKRAIGSDKKILVVKPEELK